MSTSTHMYTMAHMDIPVTHHYWASHACQVLKKPFSPSRLRKLETFTRPQVVSRFFMVLRASMYTKLLILTRLPLYTWPNLPSKTLLVTGSPMLPVHFMLAYQASHIYITHILTSPSKIFRSFFVTRSSIVSSTSRSCSANHAVHAS